MTGVIMADVRKPAVASLFYPDDTINLKRMINGYLSAVPADAVREARDNADSLFGVIVPHAGYVYSGPVAAYAYSVLRDKSFDTVILIGPSHYASFTGFALPDDSAFETPFGPVPVNREAAGEIVKRNRGLFEFMNAAHAREHSLEVQLPFLQQVLQGPFKILPVLMGSQDAGTMSSGAKALEVFLKEFREKCLIVISSDLSHYHTDGDAKKMDEELIRIVQDMDAQALVRECGRGAVEACGAGPMGVLLELARLMARTKFRTLVYRNSGEVSGDLKRVVGYLAAAVW